jgi:Chaperone of endosialidase
MMKSIAGVVAILCVLQSQSQSLAINTTGAIADASAILDVSSTAKGVLIPRVALTATNLAGPVAAPLPSLVIYNTATAGAGGTAVSPGFYYWTGTGWSRFQTGTATGAEWSLTGNAGTVPGTHFIGTTDGNDLRFKRNNQHAGLISTNSTAFGTSALNITSTGIQNTAFGSSVLTANTTGMQNTAVGFGALVSNTTGGGNIGIGQVSLLSNIDGYYNVGIGFTSLYHNTTGDYNVGIGYTALYNNDSGNYNLGIGYGACYSNRKGNGNTGIGAYAGNFNNTGDNNVAVGHYSSYLGSIGSGNVGVGYYALFTNSNGSNNVAVGNNAGFSSTGSNNITIGYDAQVPTGTADNQVRIGNTAVTYAGVQVAWTTTSDQRWKKDIHPSELGLDFIRQLKPVSYLRNNDKTQTREYGFIAQDLQILLQKMAPENGIVSSDDKGYLGVRYNDLLAPMVKAIQEQQLLIEKLQAEIEVLKQQHQ